MKQLYNFCVYAIKIISLAISCLLLVLVLINRVVHPQAGKQPMQFLEQPWWYYVLLAVSIICFIAVKKIMEKIPPKVLFAVFAIIYLAAGIYLILNVPEKIRSDQHDVFKAALQMNQGIYEKFQVGGELFKHSHNIGIAVFYSLLTALNPSTKIAFAANLVFVIMANWFIWKLSELCFEDRTVSNYTILLEFAFLPHFFYILFVYGNVPGFFFTTAMVYFAARAGKNREIADNKTVNTACIALAVFSAAAAVLLRNNYIIAVVAVMIICFIRIIRKCRLSDIAVIALLIAAIILPKNTLINHYEKKVGVEIEGAPMVLYAAMGLQWEEGEEPGWYNGYNNDVYSSTGFDGEKSAEIGRQNIKERIEYFADNPSYAYSFFKNKIISTWCEPTCEALYSGPIESAGQIVEDPLLHNLYTGKKLYTAVYIFCGLLIANFLIFAIVYQLVKFKDADINLYILFPLLFFIGGFLFHVVWETKSRYVWGYYLMLAPIAAAGIKEACGFIDKKLKK